MFPTFSPSSSMHDDPGLVGSKSTTAPPGLPAPCKNSEEGVANDLKDAASRQTQSEKAVGPGATRLALLRRVPCTYTVMMVQATTEESPQPRSGSFGSQHAFPELSYTRAVMGSQSSEAHDSAATTQNGALPTSLDCFYCRASSRFGRRQESGVRCANAACAAPTVSGTVCTDVNADSCRIQKASNS